MQYKNESYLDRRERVRRGDRLSVRPKQNIVTRIPNQASEESNLAKSPRPDVYRQAMQVILETPEMEERLSYITAGTIVTILGSWLAGSVIKSRAFTIFIDLMLFIASMALAGLLIGIMLGEGIVSGEIGLILLVGLVGLSILALLILLWSMLLQSTARSQ